MPDKQQPCRILFIGNSFTYYNEMPTGIFAEIAAAAGYTVSVKAVTAGGYFLADFANPADPYGQQVCYMLTEKQAFDIVVLQEQSSCAIDDPEKFRCGVSALADRAKATGAQVWLYETWGYRDGDDALCSRGGSTVAMEKQLRAAYTAAADKFDLHVAYAGAVMTRLYRHSPLSLYADDGQHPSLIGSYAAAWTLFAAIFGDNPPDNPYAGALSKKEADTIKEAVQHELCSQRAPAATPAYTTFVDPFTVYANFVMPPVLFVICLALLLCALPFSWTLFGCIAGACFLLFLIYRIGLYKAYERVTITPQGLSTKRVSFSWDEKCYFGVAESIVHRTPFCCFLYFSHVPIAEEKKLLLFGRHNQKQTLLFPLNKKSLAALEEISPDFYRYVSLHL